MLHKTFWFTLLGNQRCYVPVSLVDDTGVDEVMLSLSRLMMKDLNLTVSSVSPASEECLQWSASKSSSSISTQSNAKSSRVLILVLNSSVFAKFEATLADSAYEAEQTGSIESTEEVLADTNSAGFPISAIAGPPTMSDGQQASLKALAAKYSVSCIICIPKNILEGLEEGKK